MKNLRLESFFVLLRTQKQVEIADFSNRLLLEKATHAYT
jgi:hypothetical protein